MDFSTRKKGINGNFSVKGSKPEKSIARFYGVKKFTLLFC